MLSMASVTLIIIKDHLDVENISIGLALINHLSLLSKEMLLRRQEEKKIIRHALQFEV